MRGQALGLPCAVLHTPEEFLHDAQAAARHFAVTLPDGRGGTVTLPRGPFTSTPPLLRHDRVAPAAGRAQRRGVRGGAGPPS